MTPALAPSRHYGKAFPALNWHEIAVLFRQAIVDGANTTPRGSGLRLPSIRCYHLPRCCWCCLDRRSCRWPVGSPAANRSASAIPGRTRRRQSAQRLYPGIAQHDSRRRRDVAGSANPAIQRLGRRHRTARRPQHNLGCSDQVVNRIRHDHKLRQERLFSFAIVVAVGFLLGGFAGFEHLDFRARRVVGVHPARRIRFSSPLRTRCSPS